MTSHPFARPVRCLPAALVFLCVASGVPRAQKAVPPPGAGAPGTAPGASAPAPPAMPPEVRRAIAQFQAADKLRQQGKVGPAIAAFQEFLRLGALAKMNEQMLLPAYDSLYRLYQARNDAKGMETTLQKLARIMPQNPGIWVEYATLYMGQKRFAEADANAQKALALKPPPPLAAQAHFVRGVTAYARQKFALAEAEYTVAVKLAPANPQAQFNLLLTLSEEKKTKQAIAVAERLLKIAPRMVPARMILAGLRTQARDLPLAVAQYSAVLKIEPRNPGALFNRALLYQQMGRLPEAQAGFIAYTDFYPKDANAQFNLGALYQRANNLEAARKHFGLAVQQNPKEVRALTQLAICERELGLKLIPGEPRATLLNKAIGHFKQAMALAPKDATLDYHLGALYERAGRFDEALALYRHRQQEDPNDPVPYRRMMNVFVETRRMDDAVAEWHNYRARKPNDPLSYEQIADILDSQGKWKEASEERLLQIQHDPKDGFAKLALAREYRALKQPENAESEYRLILAADVNALDVAEKERVYAAASRRNWRLRAWRGLAELAEEGKRTDEAIGYLRSVQQDEAATARRDQKYPPAQAFLDIARLYEGDKKIVEARKELKALTDARPDDPKGFVALAEFEDRQGSVEESVAAYNRAEERAPDPILYGLLAEGVYQKHQQFDKAIAELNRLRTKYPKDGRLQAPLAQLMEQAGNDAGALAIYDALLKTAPGNVTFMDKRASVLTRLKRYPEARAQREAIVERTPQDYQAYANVGYQYTLENHPEAYRQWLKTRVEKDPACAPALSALVDAYQQQMLEEDGWKLAQEIALKHKNDLDVQDVYAGVLAQHKRLPEAIAVRRALSAAAPNDLDALTRLADLLVENKQPEEANKVFADLIERTDLPLITRLNARRLLASRLETQNKWADAIAQYQALLKADARDLAAVLSLGNALGQANRDVEAIALYSEYARQAALSANIRSNFFFLLGGVYEKQGNKPQAAEQYQQALRLNPNSRAAGQAARRVTDAK